MLRGMLQKVLSCAKESQHGLTHNALQEEGWLHLKESDEENTFVYMSQMWVWQKEQVCYDKKDGNISLSMGDIRWYMVKSVRIPTTICRKGSGHMRGTVQAITSV